MKMKKGLFIFWILSFIYCDEDEIFFFYQKINKTNNNNQGDNNINHYNISSTLNISQVDLNNINLHENLRNNIKENLNNTLNDVNNNVDIKNIQINKDLKIINEKELLNNENDEKYIDKKEGKIIHENNNSKINSKEKDDILIKNKIEKTNYANINSTYKNKYNAFIKKPNQNNNSVNTQSGKFFEKFFDYINNISKGKINILIRKYLFDIHNVLKKYIPYPYDYLIAFFIGYFTMNLFIFSNKKIKLNKIKSNSDENISIINEKLKELLQLQDNIKKKEKNKSNNNFFNKIDFSKFNILESKLNQLLKISSTRNLFSSSENAIRENICALQMNIMKKIDNTIKI